MNEVGVDGLEMRPLAEVGEELLAQTDERGCAARRVVEAAKQLLPARLGGDVEGVDRFVAGAVLEERLDGRS